MKEVEQRQSVNDADEPRDVERESPAEVRGVRDVAAEAADDDAAVNRRLVQPDGTRPRVARMEIGKYFNYIKLFLAYIPTKKVCQ